MVISKKMVLFKILSFIGLLAPIAALFIVRRDVYFVNDEGIKISIGCMIALVLTILLMMGKLKTLNGTIWLAIIWGLAYFLRSIINDILIIIPCAIMGLMIYNIFDYFYKNSQDLARTKRNAKITAKAFSDERIMPNGRG